MPWWSPRRSIRRLRAREALTVEVELEGRWTTGETVTDWRRAWGRSPNLDVAVEADADALLRALRRAHRAAGARSVDRSADGDAHKTGARNIGIAGIAVRPLMTMSATGRGRDADDRPVRGTLARSAERTREDDEEVGVSATWLRVGGGLLAFALIAGLGLAGLSGLDIGRALDRFALVMIVAIPAGVASLRRRSSTLQTRRLDSITRQFDTRTLVLMPVAMALNIVLGTAVASALKIPIYLDSIGTILVAALAGPLAGAATGFLTNVIWTYLAPPPFASPFAVPFAVVAVVVGLLAGTFARWGWLRPRRGASATRADRRRWRVHRPRCDHGHLAVSGWRPSGRSPGLAPRARMRPACSSSAGWRSVAGRGDRCSDWSCCSALRRDLAAAYILVAGVITGVVAAFMAAPIAAGLFGGVTGSGADFVIAAFRQAGADLQQAVLGQSLISDPVDKVITFFVVYLILGAMATRTKARFPQGEYLLPISRRRR